MFTLLLVGLVELLTAGGVLPEISFPSQKIEHVATNQGCCSDGALIQRDISVRERRVESPHPAVGKRWTSKLEIRKDPGA